MKQYVIVKGGLGNQMFQYAFYLSLKSKERECVLDTSLFDVVTMHQGYELERVFDISAPIASRSWLHRNTVRILYKFKPKSLVFADEPFICCRDALESRRKYFMGCWIHPSYFVSIEEEVRNAFRFNGISEKNRKFSEELKNIESVSIHIRRGDYLNTPIYDVCKEDYHKKAIGRIIEKVDNPFFIVFSDDVQWCNDYLGRFNVNYKMVDWNKGKDSYQDMFLMTQCKHNIIANSTFSWWGAWLNQNKNKIVIAPGKWTTNREMERTIKDWVFIDV